MSEPIPLRTQGPTHQPPLTADEYMAVQKQKHDMKMQWAFILILGGILGAFLIPLSVWLTRMAGGG